MRRLLALTAATALLTAGCGSQSPDPTGRPAPAAASVSPTPPADVTLAFAGDVHFSGRTLALLDDPATAFGQIIPVLAAADVAIVNLETAITARGVKEPKTFHFRAPVSSYDAIKAAGVDAVSIANNHALDYGRVGLADTLDAAKAAGVAAFGGGLAATAYQPWVKEVRGTRIAVLGLEHVAELWERWSATDTRPGLAMARDTARLDAAVAAARAQADVLVAFLHWGAEYDGCPTAEMSGLARRLVDAGVDLIVGSHAHRLQGAGWLGDSYVAYGLGNFLWWRNDASSNDTGVLEVTIRENRIVQAGLRPAMIDRVTGQPMPASAADGERILAEQEQLRACAGLRAQRSVN